jgi:hypothetical protein
MSLMSDPSDPYAPPPDLSTLHADAFSQASCYSLPYGAVGFASHLITYYTMIALILGRTPLYPWRRLEYPISSAISGIIQFIGTTVLTCISISRCNAEEPFRLMGAWMLMTSVAVSMTTIAAPYAFGTTKEEILAEKVMQETIKKERKSFDMIALARMEGSDRKFPVPGVAVQLYVEDPARKKKREMGKIGLFWVAMIWVAGSIMGVYGVILFCEGRWSAISTLNTVTAVFTLAVFWPTAWIICGIRGMKSDTFLMLFVIQLFLVCSFGLLWMDWTVGAMTGNLVGVPGTSARDGQVAKRLAWIYFALKRLPLLGL